MFKTPNKTPTVERILTKNSYYPPTVNITMDVLAKTKAYVEGTDIEVAWILMVEETGVYPKLTYTIYDTALLEQTRSSTSADMTEEGMQNYMKKLIKDGKEEDINKIRGWGHSHVNMGVTPSGTDDATYEEYYKSTPFFIRLIANKKGEIGVDVINRENEIKFNNIQWNVVYEDEFQKLEDKRQDLLSEIEKVLEEVDLIEEELTKTFEERYEKYKEPLEKAIENVTKTKTYGTTGTYGKTGTYGTASTYNNKKDEETEYYYNGIVVSKEKFNGTFEGDNDLYNTDYTILSPIMGYGYLQEIESGLINKQDLLEELEIYEAYDHEDIIKIAACETIKSVKSLDILVHLEDYYDLEDWHMLWNSAKKYEKDFCGTTIMY